ncbi:MAG: ABC transporter ATP-binding protein [Bacteroidetes bacterium HGW-Bacteroidetes-4]|jgi:phospholipid/cholesterol/gamma-HCH transport system ATP-binding protein|nr:MAG: ABC transporter ATP-binding protein [Bacteroidetes bacterium HGW-Bacteroidetes-4]
MIVVEGVNKTFNEAQILKNVEAKFHPGKVNMVIGKSGSGKTVLLKSLVGLHKIDSGSITFDGRDFTKMRTKEKIAIRKEVGMLFQGGALFDSSTIEENVIYPLDMFTNFTKAEKLKRANFCLERVNLTGVNKQFPSELSGGMQKRAAIARAIALNPKYLFCDEPNSGLDPQTAIVIDKLIQEITKEYGITTVVNTHDMNSVLAGADSVVFIFEGHSWWHGSRTDLLDSGNPELDDFLFSSELMRRIRPTKQHK